MEPEKQQGVEGREAARVDAGNESQGSTVAEVHSSQDRDYSLDIAGKETVTTEQQGDVDEEEEQEEYEEDKEDAQELEAMIKVSTFQMGN